MHMSPEMRRLLRWFDRKTGYKLDAHDLAVGLSAEKTAPPTMRETLRKYKRKNKNDRGSLTLSYMAGVPE